MQRFYLPQLDALRFFAFFSVFCHHNLFLRSDHLAHVGRAVAQALTVLRNSLSFGLSLFFFLSAFLITALLELEKKRTGSIDIAAFYTRRVLRIWPLYFFYIGGLALAGHIWPALHVGAAKFAGLSLLAGNWYFMAAGMTGVAITHLWSISVEEQFYAVWPSIFRACSRRGLLAVAAALGIVSIIATVLFARTGSSALHIWLNTLCEAIFFAGGGAAGLLFSVAPKPNKLFSATLVFCGFLA